MSIIDEEILEDLNDNTMDDYVGPESEEYMNIVLKFLSQPCTNPMVIFYLESNEKIFKDVEYAASALSMRTAKINLQDVSLWATGEFPNLSQKSVIEIDYNPEDGKGYDGIIALAELLAQTSGKFVILYCRYNNKLERGEQTSLGSMTYKLKYNDLVERCFQTWHERVYMFVADYDNVFANNQEIWHACNGKGYIDQIVNAIKRHNNIVVERIKAEAPQKCGSFQVSHEELKDGFRYSITSAIPDWEDVEVLKDCGYGNLVLKMEYEISTGGSFLSCKTFDLNGQEHIII